MDKQKLDQAAGPPSWLERNVNLVIAALVIACLATLVAQAMFRFEIFGLHPFFDDHHPAHFDLEHLFGFNALFGFAAFIVVVFLGRFLRLIVKRKEDYYDP